jgi:hypothetical protein
MESAKIHLATDTLANRPGWLALAAARLRSFRRSLLWKSLISRSSGSGSSISRSSISGSSIWKSLIRKSWAFRIRVRRPRKQLSIRETAALGDRRFVSVIQFERRRFLIGSSPSSITLLSRLPDECGSVEEEKNIGKSGEQN